jgi:hypothetical protein
LLGLECELDEDLLKLLVDVIDTKLLEAVILEDFKSAVAVSVRYVGNGTGALNIENTDDIFGSGLRLHGDVDPAHNPLEEVVVAIVSSRKKRRTESLQGLGESVTTR